MGLAVRQIQRYDEADALAFAAETIGSCPDWRESLRAYRWEDSFEEDWEIEAGRWLLFARDQGFLKALVEGCLAEERATAARRVGPENRDAAEFREAGDEEGARDLLMEVLGTDLRCLDAHGHLGNLVFDRSPERAMAHYDIGVKIGELSLPPGFDGLLVWGRIYNRPFLRCLHGYGLCLWRLGRFAEAQRVFERILSLNPSDNQGVRFCWQDVRKGGSWEEMQARKQREHARATGQLN